jgi:hypothetical protein
VAGVAAGLLSRVHCQGRTEVFSQFCEVMVDPTLRRGLRRGATYRALLDAVIGEALRTGAALVFGLPNENSDRMVQALFRGRTLHQVSRVLRPTGPASGLSPTAWPSRLRYAVRPVADPALLDVLWERCRPEFPLTTIRDRAYLSWRYLRCPHTTYALLLAWDRRRGRPAGLSVLRMGWQGEPICAIVDWLVPRDEPAAGVALLAHTERAARRAGMREVTAWLPPDSPERQWFLARGYRVELTRYPLLTIIPDSSPPTAWVARHWYYTMGDSDIF